MAQVKLPRSFACMQPHQAADSLDSAVKTVFVPMPYSLSPRQRDDDKGCPPAWMRTKLKLARGGCESFIEKSIAIYSQRSPLEMEMI